MGAPKTFRPQGGGKRTENKSRELATKEKQAIRKLVAKLCANYDRENGCLLLNAKCPMCGVAYSSSVTCRYFREAVLPEDPELQASLENLPVRECKYCGRKFPIDGRRVYCSEKCAEAARREQNAARTRKFRNRKKQPLHSLKP